MKRILVTGGAGFIGSNLCEKLLSQSEDNFVICMDNFFSGNPKNIEGLKANPRFTFVYGDVTEPLNGTSVDEIYHLACPASPPHYQKDPVYTTLTNVMGTFHALELARRHHSRFLFAGTSEVYGDPSVHPQTEDYRGNVSCTGIRACYDEGKRCAESLVFDYHRMYGLLVKSVRIFNTYGPNMSMFDGRVVPNFIVQALREQPLTIYGTGNQTRSLCYVDDLVEGLILMMASPNECIGPLNLGNPAEYSIGEIAKVVCRLTETRSTIVHCPLPADDPTKRKPNIDKAKQLLNWEPRIGVEKGLVKTIDYFRKEICA